MDHHVAVEKRASERNLVPRLTIRVLVATPPTTSIRSSELVSESCRLVKDETPLCRLSSHFSLSSFFSSLFHFIFQHRLIVQKGSPEKTEQSIVNSTTASCSRASQFGSPNENLGWRQNRGKRVRDRWKLRRWGVHLSIQEHRSQSRATYIQE